MPARERRPRTLPRTCRSRTSPRATSSAPTSARARRSASEAKAYMDAGDLVPDEVTIAHGQGPDGAARRRRAASCWTASRATSRRPRRSTRCLKAEGMQAGRRAGPGGPRGRGRQADRRPAHLPQRLQRTSSTSTYNPPKAGGRLRRLRRRAVPARRRLARRRSASGSRSTTRRPSRSSTTTRPRAWSSPSPRWARSTEVTKRAMEALQQSRRRLAAAVSAVRPRCPQGRRGRMVYGAVVTCRTDTLQ